MDRIAHGTSGALQARQGVPDEATPEWIRANVDQLLAALEQAFDIGRHGRPSSLLRVPRRMNWLCWLLSDLDQITVLDFDE